MLQQVLNVSDGNARLLERAVADIPAEHFTRQFPHLPNHPAWQVGHLTLVRARVVQMIGGPRLELPEPYYPLFNPGSEPTANPADYPEKVQLLAAFRNTHQAAVDYLRGVDASTLQAPHPLEPLRREYPTTADLVANLFTTHDGLHLGQLSLWRKAMGLPRIIR